jgi:hypothetical protein
MIIRPERKILRKMNFLSDQEGIMSRYLKESSNWESHLNNSREFILKSVRKRKISKISLLGSGWLLDVPLDELTKMFSEILLIDIFHPPQILHKLKKIPRVKHIEMDITGGMIHEVYHLVKEFRKSGKKKDVSLLQSKGFLPQFNPGFVVSLNILNQLDILIVDYLKKYEVYNDEEILMIRRIIQQAHLNSLPEGNSCLISDVEEMIYDREQLEKRNALVHVPIPEGKRRNTWEWLFDSQKTYHPGKITRFNVVAVEL